MICGYMSGENNLVQLFVSAAKFFLISSGICVAYTKSIIVYSQAYFSLSKPISSCGWIGGISRFFKPIAPSFYRSVVVPTERGEAYRERIQKSNGLCRSAGIFTLHKSFPWGGRHHEGYCCPLYPSLHFNTEMVILIFSTNSFTFIWLFASAYALSQFDSRHTCSLHFNSNGTVGFYIIFNNFSLLAVRNNSYQ